MIESYTSKETIARAADAANRAFFHGREPWAERDHLARMAAARAEAAERRAEALRLVKAAKSPTDRFPGLTGAYFNRPPTSRPPAALEIDEKPGFSENARTPGTWAVVERREWAGEHRIRFETRPGYAVETPDQAGDRVTAMLSERGARKISESCYYLACKRGGYTTFATLTLSEESRRNLQRRTLEPETPITEDGFTVQEPKTEPARPKMAVLGPVFSEENQTTGANQAATIAGRYTPLHPTSGRPFTPLKPRWALSVQKEASRFFEAAGQMYKRGWQYQNEKGETVRVPGSRALYCVEGEETDRRTGARFTRLKWWREPIDYLWVAENPDRVDEETGEYLGENPHIHLMMRWRVPYRHFEAWAARLEKLWGHGFAHLEKIKDPQKAGAYVAKAAGYLTKGQGKADQGEIRGNRYGISKRARAPGWIESERYQVGLMGWLMAEAHELWNNRHGEKIQRREQLKRELEAVNDAPRRQKIGRILEQVRAEIEPLPRISKYGAVFKSEEQKARFFEWATRRGWTPEQQESQWLYQWRREQWRRRNGSRLMAGANEWAAWFALADAGAVACNDEDRGELIAV
ncbi:hypothetical protein [Marinobacter alkaliphilus]|uniref:Uncharacterized protein n=1 Tax=Marinobacter alkaliphilus TaxID=254719 RepID=A0ABZ3E832_9GAMM